NAKRAAVMAGMLRDRRLGLPDDEELIEELAGLILIERSPGQFRIDHRPGKHDDRAQAIALVASELAHERKRARARSQPAPQGLGGSAPGWMYGGSQHDGGSDDHRRWVRWRWQETGEHPCPECERERAEAEAVARSREGRADAAASDRLVRFLSDRARPGGKGGQVEMTDRAARAVQRLRTEVEARVGPLHEVEAPKTPAEARKLAREDSELFSALFEAGRLTPEALGAKEGRK
ncbi:MAG TPA: hypothetical protein VK932_24265, partial [Kofleriaceae bacterium]|nr:hypothetical protein [Kofleriaceae bacterium]